MRPLAVIAAWLSVTAVLGGLLAGAFAGRRRTVFLPGPATDGHYQIIEKCELCHTQGDGVRQDACLGCHEAELEDADDSHPPSKFLDPRNAAYVARLDARRCVTCHAEHRPALTHAVGVTRPVDHCQRCHDDVATQHPSHAGLAFTTCQDSGCHNYHDNRALRADFLRRHLDEPVEPLEPVVPARHVKPEARPVEPDAEASEAVLRDWRGSAHAGVTCSGCHGAGEAFQTKPAQAVCAGCHEGEAESFARGRHGMRAAAGLSPMTPGQARRPMAPGRQEHELGCTSCHGAHAFDTRRAAAEACLTCHADEHSLAWLGSPHARLWEAEVAGVAPEGSGVSCATCHLPRVDSSLRGTIVVQHDQNEGLRPREKMLRPVCQACHGVAFSLAALADDTLVQSNFLGSPAGPARSLQMLEEGR